MKESEGTEEITTFPLYPYLLQGQQALPNCKPISAGLPRDKQSMKFTLLIKMKMPTIVGIFILHVINREIFMLSKF